MNGAFTSRHMRGASQEQMIRRRDASGDEATKLARIMNEPDPKPEEITSYVRELEKKGHMPTEEARRLLASIPHDPAALRVWARNAFALVMHQGIHAHAAYPRQLYPSPPANK
jgi:hypothetical protein